MNYHLVDLKFVTGKDAQSICRDIAGSLPNHVIEKTTSFLGDTAATQLKTQRLLEKYFEVITENQEHMPQYTCLMHTGKSKLKRHQILSITLDKIFPSGKNLGDNHSSVMPPDIKTFLDVMELVFGDREGSSFHQISLKQPLEDRLFLEGAKMKGVKIVNRRGSRAGIYAANSLAIIQYHNHIVPVLESGIAKTARKTTAAAKKQLARLTMIFDMLTKNWKRTHLYLGTIVMIHLFLVKVIHRAENHNLSVTDKKALVQDLVDRYNKLLHQTGQPFEKLRCLGLRLDCTLSGAETLAVRETEKLYQGVSTDQQTELDQFIIDGSTKALKKLEKDCAELMKLPNSDDLVPSTNRNLEGSFGCFKHIEKTFTAMDPWMQETVTRAMVNKLLDWFEAKSPDEQQELLKQAKQDRSYDQAQVKESKIALKRQRTNRE